MIYNAGVGTWLLCYLVFSRVPNVADCNELLVCTVCVCPLRAGPLTTMCRLQFEILHYIELSVCHPG